MVMETWLRDIRRVDRGTEAPALVVRASLGQAIETDLTRLAQETV